MAPVWSTTLRPDTMIGQPLEKADHDQATMRGRKSLLGTLILCRHGATDYHPDRFYEAGDGPPLSAQGLGHAEALGRWFERQALPVAGLYVSPTLRTRQTAAAIERVLGVHGSAWPDLTERSMGRWNGRLVDEVRRDDPDGWMAWKADPVGFTPKGGESLENFGQKIEATVADLIARHPGGMIVAVTHVGTIRAALCAALGCALEHGKRLVIEPGSVTRLDYTTGWPNVVWMGVQPT
jgi:probable phosphoglycerate mutase